MAESVCERSRDAPVARLYGRMIYDALVLSTARYPGWPTPKAMRSVMRSSWRSLVKALTVSAVAS